jgi:hypothetical protein
VFHVYRHLSKTGGTTARFVFDRQTVFGDFEYPLEYGFDEKKWDDLLSRWRKKADAFLANDKNENADASPPPRTLVEIRGNWPSNWPAEAFEGRILTDVETLRFEYGENSFVVRRGRRRARFAGEPDTEKIVLGDDVADAARPF